MNKTPEIIKKYQRMIDNIKWHLDTNKPTDKMELQKCNQQINDYTEMISDLNLVSQFTPQVEVRDVWVWVKAIQNKKLEIPDNIVNYHWRNSINEAPLNIEHINRLIRKNYLNEFHNIEWLSKQTIPASPVAEGWVSRDELIEWTRWLGEMGWYKNSHNDIWQHDNEVGHFSNTKELVDHYLPHHPHHNQSPKNTYK